MCARPRRVSDEEVFEAALRAMAMLPPSELTLAAIGAEVGVTAGALVQRFGSKRQLLLTLARKAAEGGPKDAGHWLAAHGSPMAALEAYAACMSGHATSPAAFQRGLAYLQQDLADPELQDLLAKQTDGMRATIARLAAAARDAGEIRAESDPDRLARLIEALIAGGMMSWAYRPEGKAADWVLALLRDLLMPYRPKLSRPARRRSRS